MPNFSEALIHLKKKQTLTRRGWNGKGLSISLIIPSPPRLDEENNFAFYRPFIGLKLADGSVVSWVVSHEDILSSDWEIVETKG